MIEELLKLWNNGGPAILRAGGLSVRELKRVANALDVSEPIAAFWVELAYAAGLLATDGEADERYAATPAYDDWLELPAQDRWTRLAAAWLAATRTAGLVGGQDAKGRALSALGAELDRSAAPEVRRRVLALFASLPRAPPPTRRPCWPASAGNGRCVRARPARPRPPATSQTCAPASPCGPSTRRSCSASPAAGPSPPRPGHFSTRAPARRPPASPRSSPSPSTTSCSRPT